MKKVLTPGRNLALSILLGSTGGAWALSLGTPATDAWIGRPLQMTVPASFGGAVPDDECVQADVFYGDKRLPPSAVRATVVGPAGQRQVRVEARPLVDEPVVTVSLRAGCHNSVTRNYTLLPELPSEAMIAQWNRAAAPAGAATPAAAPLRLATSTGSARARRAPAVAAVAATNTPEAAPPRIRPRTARPAHRRAPTGPRLVVEPIEFEAPPASLLRVSTDLANPAGNPAQRAAAALLWQAINADPQQVLRTSAMLQQLEHDMAQLQQANRQTHAEVMALRQRLDQAKQPWYVSRGIVQLLALLALAGGAAAGLLWLRARRNASGLPAWYQPVPEHPEPALTVEAAEAPKEVQPPAPPQRMQPVVDRRVVERPAADRRLVERPAPPVAMPARAPVAATTARPTGPGPIDFELPEAARPPKRTSSGMLRVETLAATFEEVEFLSSLGLANDATDVLKAYLEDSASPAPLAFYELMRVCDGEGDATAVGAVRRRYRQVFGVEAPQVEQVKAPLGVDGFAALSGRITQAWGQREAVDVIEQALFDAPAPGAALTLQAGRELLVLHGLALALLAEATAPERDTHPLAPWAHAEDAAHAHAVVQDHADAEGGHRFALDVDLGAAPEALPEPTPEPLPAPAVEVGPLLAELQAASAREAAQRRQQEQEDAFSAAVASERMPLSRL